MKKLYGMDLGGTNVRIAEVNPENGKIESDITNVPLAQFNGDYRNFKRFLLDRIPSGSKIGTGAAGTIDELAGAITYSANSPLGEYLPVAKDFRDNGYEAEITNDTRGELQAVILFAEGQGRDNVLLATYSTGNNCSASHGGLIDRTNPEFGHQGHTPTNELFRDITCGCGIDNHIETYVSGTGAADMARKYFRGNPISRMKDNAILQSSIDELNAKGADYTLDSLTHAPTRRIIIDNLKGPHVYNAFKSHPDQEPQKMIAETQREAITESLVRMNIAYRPLDIMVLKGGQTTNWEELFVPAIQSFNSPATMSTFFDRPEVVRTEIPEDQIGIIGAAADFLNKNR